jgi:pimeloyl-ACP methyl ester carboxylesterase
MLLALRRGKPGTGQRRRPARWAIAGGVIALLAVLLLVNAVLINAETKPAEVTHARGQLLDLPGGEQQIVDQGLRSEQALLLLHPYVSSVYSWEKVAEATDSRFRVVRVDLLGFGGSEKPDSGYAIEDQADYLAAAMERLGSAARSSPATHSGPQSPSPSPSATRISWPGS